MSENIHSFALDLSCALQILYYMAIQVKGCKS
jgi:hypothetical protein